MKSKIINQKTARRKNRVRAGIFGTAQKPRLSVFRSNRYTYAQLIDDAAGKTILSASTIFSDPAAAKKKEKKAAGKRLQPAELGELLAKKAAEKGIKQAVFDRGAYKFHGRVKAVAEGAKKAGLKV